MVKIYIDTYYLHGMHNYNNYFDIISEHVLMMTKKLIPVIAFTYEQTNNSTIKP